MRRSHYQFGSVQRKKRKAGPDVWVFRYTDANGKKKAPIIGTLAKYPKKGQAEKAAEFLRIAANPDKPLAQVVTFGHLIDRYKVEGMPQRYSTSNSYLAWINKYISPKWGSYPIAEVQSGNVEAWLKALPLQPKSMGNILSIMRKLHKCAMRWNLVPLGVNPMSLVELPERTKRKSKAPVLDVEQVRALIANIEKEPFRTMACVAIGLGLERSVVVGLKWADVDFLNGSIYARRGVVNNHVGDTKNEYREKNLPLHPAIAKMLEAWKAVTIYSSPDDWVFASPYRNGKEPYNPRHVAIDHFWPAAKKAEIGEKLGWQSLRRTYSSLLRKLGVDVKVQQELMRHNDVRTTMGLYTDAYSDDMRVGNTTVVTQILQ